MTKEREQELYYLRSIKSNLDELYKAVSDGGLLLQALTPLPSIGSEVLADNRNWLDCHIDRLARQPVWNPMSTVRRNGERLLFRAVPKKGDEDIHLVAKYMDGKWRVCTADGIAEFIVVVEESRLKAWSLLPPFED